MGTQNGAEEGDGDLVEPQLLTSSSSAAAFIDSVPLDACDDSCSICLEPFCHSNPATITSCKHDFHLQCILEWAQRSKDCPMCWQTLSLKDPSSQELLDVVEQEQAWRHFDHGAQLHQAPLIVSAYNEIEELIMQSLAQPLARSGLISQNTWSSEAHVEQSAYEAQLSTLRRASDAFTLNRSGTRTRSLGAERHQTNREPVHEGQQRSLSLDVPESLKSRVLVASAKCKETFTRTTRSLMERWRGRSSKAADLRARAQEVSVDVVRQARRRITPALDRNENGNEDVATTSTGTTKSGASSRCTATGRMGGVAVNVGGVAMTEALRQQSGEAV